MMAQGRERQSKHYEVSNDSMKQFPKLMFVSQGREKAVVLKEKKKLLPSNLKSFENLCQLYFNKAEIVKKN